MPEYIRLITSVSAHMEERQSVWEKTVLLYLYYKKQYVNTLPHAHGLLIKTCTKGQRIDLFGINLWFVGSPCKIAFVTTSGQDTCNRFLSQTHFDKSSFVDVLFYFVPLWFGQIPACLFLKMKNCKAPPLIGSQKAQQIITFLQRLFLSFLFGCILWFSVCSRPQEVDQHPWAVQIVKIVHTTKL